jgi:importin subunit alpha-1
MLSRSRQEERKSSLKKTITTDDSRRKREEATNELRKNKREEGLMQKRRMTNSSPQDQIDVQAISGNDHLAQITKAIYSNEPNVQFEATVHFRKLLSIERNPPIDQVIQTGVVPRLVQLLNNSGFPKLQFEAAWALTNIASGTSEQTAVLINCGALPLFVQLLSHPDDDVKEQV